jgi:hypothetical protein
MHSNYIHYRDSAYSREQLVRFKMIPDKTSFEVSVSSEFSE